MSQNKQRFDENGVGLAVSDYDFIKVCRDKRNTEDYLAKLGIAVPKALDKYHPVFPMFAKPYDGSLSTNLHVIRKQEELTKDILEDPKLIFMEYIDKQEYKEFTVDMYYGKDGKVKGIVPRERIEIRAGEINKGITRKNYILQFLKKRMDCLPGVRGCICIQLFYRETDNDIKGIEINPRFGGGFPLSYYAKANFAEYVIREYLLGESVDYSDAWLDNTLIVFEHLISAYRLDFSTNELLEIYRKHFPQICLDEETRKVIIQLRKTCKMGIVSDGRSLTQRNKINALGLSEFFDWSDIYISDEVGHLKTTPYSFEKIMAAYPDCQYLYVGDNPAKDFLVPNRLGWMTVCVLDNGQNIHPQDFTLSAEFLPQRKIKDITELLEIID